MASGQGLVDRARKHLAEEYRFVDVPKDDPDWRGPWDCAEFISWLVYQEARVLYGCDDNKGDPHKANAWTGYWKRDVDNGGIRAPVEKAAATAGGILLRFPPNVPGKFGHIVVCDGRGGTIEAMGRAYGVRAGKVAGRTWHAGILLPEISYDGSDAKVDVSGPAHQFAVDAPNMNAAIVKQIQESLKANGFDPGPIDGEFGEKTMEAAVAFQNAQGLIVDGEVGDDTAAKLGIDLAGAATAAASAATAAAAAAASAADVSASGRLGTMGPLIPIALQLLPGLIGLIAGDKTGSIQTSITKAVTDIAGTTDAAAARQKIESDPAVAAQLQLKLAQIAADQEDKRNQAQLAALKAQQDSQFQTLKAQQDAEASRRGDDLERFKAAIQDTESARAQAYAATKDGGPAAWAPIVISLIVTGGFFATFFYLVTNGSSLDSQKGTFQLVNLTLGALVAAFTTVVTFWLGSSQGSRIKDAANANAQVAQAAQTKELTQTIQAQTASNAARIDAITKTSPTPPVAPAQKVSNFQKCMDVVFANEGGFVDRSDDPGGATNFGVTINTLTAWAKERGAVPPSVDDLKNLTRENACEIYRTNYWNVLRCDDLPPGVDLSVFDFGVNAGPGRAAKTLQVIVGAASDGSIGSATIAATNAMHPQDIIDRLTQRRIDFYRESPNFATFGRGWTNRAQEVQRAATAMQTAAAA